MIAAILVDPKRLSSAFLLQFCSKQYRDRLPPSIFTPRLQGCQSSSQIRSHWPQMGQMRDFLISVSVLKADLIKANICSIWGKSEPIWGQLCHPCSPRKVRSPMCNPSVSCHVTEPLGHWRSKFASRQPSDLHPGDLRGQRQGHGFTG